VFNCHIIEWSY